MLLGDATKARPGQCARALQAVLTVLLATGWVLAAVWAPTGRVDVLEALYGVRAPEDAAARDRFRRDAAKSIAAAMIAFPVGCMWCSLMSSAPGHAVWWL